MSWGENWPLLHSHTPLLNISLFFLNNKERQEECGQPAPLCIKNWCCLQIETKTVTVWLLTGPQRTQDVCNWWKKKRGASFWIMNPSPPVFFLINKACCSDKSEITYTFSDIPNYTNSQLLFKPPSLIWTFIIVLLGSEPAAKTPLRALSAGLGHLQMWSRFALLTWCEHHIMAMALTEISTAASNHRLKN